jgi:uncharacterized protein YjiS (DUF1127 family)
MNALTHDIRSAAATAKASARHAQAEAHMERAEGDRSKATLFRVALRALANWWTARRDAARLSGYPDRMLKDIGMARGGIEWAVRHGRGEDEPNRAEDPIYTDKWSIRNEVHP